ncbi:MAG: deoxyribonuclease IV [Acidimicrobiia bacterium]|nr:deoxyribonuclease IV [Acidimicrobiia bacterium]MDH3397525.1 deoxyribonuclease IV [Acidimicrobiia bacterium]
MLIGAHVNNVHPLEEAASRKADVVQMFASNPQSWKKPLPRPDCEELKAASVPIYVHAPYLINVVSPNNRVRIPSRKILAETLEAAGAFGAAAVIVHGGHVTDEESIEEGPERWRKALEPLETDLPILIENTAGGGAAMARQVDDIARLWEEIGDLGPGFCLDTCHFWAAGEDLAGLVERVMAATGRIDLIHCNDSRDAFDSRRDRHTNLGKGEIPPELLLQVVREAGAPVVVETPGGSEEQGADIAWLRANL